MIYIDRSRIQSYDDCHRMRFLNYHWGGTGLDKKDPSLPLLEGQLIHTAIESVAANRYTVDEAVTFAVADLDIALREIGEPEQHFLNEQHRLLDGLVRLWTKYRLPILLQEFEIVSIEDEFEWPLDKEVSMMVRCDMILRRRSDGTLFILEFKTVGMAGEEWAKQWENNSQVLSYTGAVEWKYQQPCGGVIIDGLVKGRRVKEKGQNQFNGQTIQQSPICYCYHRDGVFSSKWTRGWDKVATWEHMSTEKWLQMGIGEEGARDILIPGLPIRIDATEIDSWKRQTIEKERGIKTDLISVEYDPSTDGGAIDCYFPKNYNHCRRYYGYPCKFLELCTNRQVANDPLGSGLYVERTPHHKAELDARQSLEKKTGSTKETSEAADAIL